MQFAEIIFSDFTHYLKEFHEVNSEHGDLPLCPPFCLSVYMFHTRYCPKNCNYISKVNRAECSLTVFLLWYVFSRRDILFARSRTLPDLT